MCGFNPLMLPWAGPADPLRKNYKPEPNPIRLSTDPLKVEVTYKSIILLKADPGVDFTAVPYKQTLNLDNGTCYTSQGTGANRVLLLDCPGTWAVKLLAGGTAVEAVLLDAWDCCSALFYGGVRIANTVSTGVAAPGTFASSHPAVITVNGDAQVLAAGNYGHLSFQNVSGAGQNITLTGNGETAIDLEGWYLPAGIGSKAGGLRSWNHPDKMPIGPFRAISDAANGVLSVTTGI